MVRRLFDTLIMKLPKGESKAGWLVLALLIILILAPLLSVLLQIIVPGYFWGNRQPGQLDLLLEVFRRPFWLRSFQNSLIIAFSTTALGTLLGTVLAILRSSWDFPTAKWLDIAAWLLLVTPSFIIAQGWILFAANDGVASQLLGATFVGDFIFHPSGFIFIMVLCKFPLAYLAVRAAMSWNVESLSQSAQLTGASSLTIWLVIRLPLLKPAIRSGAALVFMDSIGDYGIPATMSALYRFPTLPYAIHSAIYSSPVRFDMAGVLSFYLILIIMLVLLIQLYIMRNTRYDSLTAGAVRSKQRKLPKHAWLVTLGNILFLGVAVGVPIGCTLFISLVHSPSAGFAWSNLTFSHYSELFADRSMFLESLLRSLTISTVAALVALAIGVIIAYVLVFVRFKLKAVIEVTTLVALAVPGVVLGIGYIFVWNQKWLEPYGLLLYGTPAILVLAAIAGAIPITTRILSGMMATIPRSMLDAAQLQGASWMKRAIVVLFPLCKTTLLTAALSAFGISVFDLAASSLLFPPGQMTLPVMINRAFENMRFGYAAAATTLGGIIVISVIVSINRLAKLELWRKQ